MIFRGRKLDISLPYLPADDSNEISSVTCIWFLNNDVTTGTLEVNSFFPVLSLLSYLLDVFDNQIANNMDRVQNIPRAVLSDRVHSVCIQNRKIVQSLRSSLIRVHSVCFRWLVGFVALRPKSTAMVIAGRSVHLTTLFPGQA